MYSRDAFAFHTRSGRFRAEPPCLPDEGSCPGTLDISPRPTLGPPWGSCTACTHESCRREAAISRRAKVKRKVKRDRELAQAVLRTLNFNDPAPPSCYPAIVPHTCRAAPARPGVGWKPQARLTSPLAAPPSTERCVPHHHETTTPTEPRSSPPLAPGPGPSSSPAAAARCLPPRVPRVPAAPAASS